MSPRVRTWHGEVTAELAWSGSGSRSEITPAVGRTVRYPPPPPQTYNQTWWSTFGVTLKTNPTTTWKTKTGSLF
ncbi:hypothetical protein HanXRQr2_Chr07g0283511 [Helianthus annuus]|uniref:Uncharacterized protein n=1 Tax=Helianthus annuus TaxID=4232 RepID=A0A9K3IIT4_HELAN|nr:hypothetical protein HanXRQr2_Chr07g0283511 [Helianthus annuus]